LLSTEEWALSSLLPPVLGLLFIFHYGKEHKDHKTAQHDQIIEKGQHVDESLFFMKQYAKNACGSVGVFHILANLPEE
jgi:ubiquitin carboxyl-terminal hydrolase L3